MRATHGRKARRAGAFGFAVSGPLTCLQGYVSREALPTDHVCVTPDVRAQAQANNAAAQSRYEATAPAVPPLE